jgi:hypothetical protein
MYFNVVPQATAVRVTGTSAVPISAIQIRIGVQEIEIMGI